MILQLFQNRKRLRCGKGSRACSIFAPIPNPAHLRRISAMRELRATRPRGRRRLWSKPKRKQFFFEKKNQKTFIYCCGHLDLAHAPPLLAGFCTRFPRRKSALFSAI
jgi:hypothetical protein